MKRHNNRGYTKEEYYQISSKNGLPKRCPILRNCCRAVETRYYMGFQGDDYAFSFEKFLETKGQRWEPETMIKSIEQITCGYSKDFFYVQNVCPEVPLFETEYLPFSFRQAAFGDASYDKISNHFDATAKHYSECSEFAEFSFQVTTKGKSSKKRTRATISKGKRFEILQRDHFRCHYCRKHKDELPKGVQLEIDHKLPRAAGGDDSFDNLVTACSTCNRGKSDKIFNGL